MDSAKLRKKPQISFFYCVIYQVKNGTKLVNQSIHRLKKMSLYGYGIKIKAGLMELARLIHDLKVNGYGALLT
jgi:hypothetical protein